MYTHKRLAVVAPTGIAAINVNGQTIHSFFGLAPSVQDPFNTETVYKGLSDKRIALFKELDALIIDEISMVRVDVMTMIDFKLKAARGSNEPFGGVQIIAFGDLFQLPPIVQTDKEESYFEEVYHTKYFFGTPSAAAKPFKVLELSSVMRQKDAAFISVLNNIRTGCCDLATLDKLNTRCKRKPDDIHCITLVPTNKAAEIYNNDMLEKIDAEPVIYHGRIEGSFELEDLPVPKMLILKPGAQVMLLTNNSGKWVNGTIGIVSQVSPEIVSVKTSNGIFKIDKNTWTKYEYTYDSKTKSIDKREIGYYIQFPIKLAYAITIHKSQGQTYDAVEIDYSHKGAFAPGQTYVALSRCKNFHKLFRG